MSKTPRGDADTYTPVTAQFKSMIHSDRRNHPEGLSLREIARLVGLPRWTLPSSATKKAVVID
jgi:hypothetical protein